MKSITYMFAVKNYGNGYIFTESPESEIEKYPEAMVVHDTKMYLYNHNTSKIEKITKVEREVTEESKKRYKIAHSKYSEVDKDEAAIFSFYKDPNKVIFEDYKMEYTDPMKIKDIFTTFVPYFTPKETVTLTTQEGNTLTTEFCKIKKVSIYPHEDIYKFKVSLNNNILSLVMYDRQIYYHFALICRKIHTVLKFDLNTGLSYYGNNEDEKISKMKNSTTGTTGCDLLDIISDDVMDIIITMVKEFISEKFGVDTTCVHLASKMDTIKSYIFNPLCNVMYLYKPFFNTRFRVYFKRNDITTNHFEQFCTMLKIPYEKKFMELSAQYHQNIFLIKCLYDAGIKNTDNIVQIVETLADCQWFSYHGRMFISKYYGEQTDYLLSYNNYNDLEYRYALCTYITKALEYLDENALVEMFVRSITENSKYWKKSLPQIAVLIDLNDYSRELMRKACSYGLNKIQSDAIDLAYDKILLKNKFINYSTEEMEMETNIGDFYFKRPLDMSEISLFLEDIKYNNTNIALSAARKINNILLLKDTRGEPLACLVIRHNDLIHVYATRHSLRHSDKEIKEICKEFCGKFKIRQYLCDDFKDKSTTLWF